MLEHCRRGHLRCVEVAGGLSGLRCLKDMGTASDVPGDGGGNVTTVPPPLVPSPGPSATRRFSLFAYLVILMQVGHASPQSLVPPSPPPCLCNVHVLP